MRNKKYSEFLKLVKKSVKLKDLTIGTVLYDGFGKLTIKSKPYIRVNTRSLFIDVDYEFQDGYTVEDNFISLADHNVVNGGYNLYRLFDNKDDAEKYNEIKSSYEYFVTDKIGHTSLKLKIKPIAGEFLDLDTSEYETREITRLK